MIKEVCVLASGGLDSAALMLQYLNLGRRVYPLYVAGGFAWEEAELYWLCTFLKNNAAQGLKPLQVCYSEQRVHYPLQHWARTNRVPHADASWDSVYMPGRNMLLLSQAAVFSRQRGINRIGLAVLRGNPFHDAKPEYFRAMEQVMGPALRIEAPFAHLSKVDLVRSFGAKLLEETISCLNPVGYEHCGRCTKYHERHLALAEPLCI